MYVPTVLLALFPIVFFPVPQECGARPVEALDPFRTAVPFWGQNSQIPSSLSPERDCTPKRVKRRPRVRTYQTPGQITRQGAHLARLRACRQGFCGTRKMGHDVLDGVAVVPQIRFVLTAALLRGTIVNRTYDTHHILYISPFLPTIFGPI